MRRQALRVGLLVRLRVHCMPGWGLATHDLDGHPLPTGPVRVARIKYDGTRLVPWVELEGINGSFRPKELDPA